MKNISVTDLQVIPELSHLRMLDFINPDNDNLVAPFLKVLGFDLDYPVEFVPSQHRNMQGKVVIAYMMTGEVECNAVFLNSVWATHEDRMIVAGYKDLSLAEDLGMGSTACRDYGNDGEGFAPDQSNPNEGEILKQITVLENLLMDVRGTPFKQDGSRKLYGESALIEAPEKRRKKPVSKVAAE